MKLSKAGLNLIKHFEGCKLTAYYCPAGVLTIGYGSTGRHVRERMAITQQQADDLLVDDLARFEIGVSEIFSGKLTQQQFDALVSFAFNLGLGALRGATLATKVKAGDFSGASREFSKWVWAGGRILPGLVKRREAERALFDSV